MPTRNNMLEMVANQMIRSGSSSRLKANKNQREMFQKRHEKQIFWAIDHLPRTSAAVHAVVVKCIIKYNDYPRVSSLCRALRKAMFNGKDDPAFLLWKFLQTHRGGDFATAYKISVCACKAYMESRTLQSLRPLHTDIFDWDEDFTVPDELLSTWNPDSVPDDQDSVVAGSC